MKTKLDAEEKEILEAYESGQTKSVKGASKKLAKYRAYAAATARKNLPVLQANCKEPMHSPEHYAALRLPFTPAQPRLIVIAESPPKSGKYFYDLDGKPTEPLFSALMESVVRIPKPASKAAGLAAFRDGGFLLLDATYTPVDGFPEGKKRDQILIDDFPKLLGYLAAADPERHAQILLVKANVCRVLSSKLQDAGYRILNRTQVVPFPANGNQGRFRTVVAALLAPRN